MLYFLKSWGFNDINYDIPMLHTQRERLELFFCQHSYFCSGLTAKDVLNSCSESTRIIYNVIQFAETDRRECCKAFYCILEVLTIRPVAIKRFPEHCWMTSLRTSSNYLSFSIEIWSVINMSFSRRAATDQGGPAGDSELYKRTITDGWQWKSPPWILEKSVAWDKNVFPSVKRYWPASVNSAFL